MQKYIWSYLLINFPQEVTGEIIPRKQGSCPKNKNTKNTENRDSNTTTKKGPTLRFVHCPKPAERSLGSPRKEKGMETRKIMGIQDLRVTCIFSTPFLKITLKAEAQFVFIICNVEAFHGFPSQMGDF